MLYFEQEVVRRVNEVVSRLAPKCREIFVKHMDGLSQREIAEQMGISEETVKKQKQIARRIIKEKIGDLWLLSFFSGRNPHFVYWTDFICLDSIERLPSW